MSSRASSWTLMEDFFVQECCVHGTDLENHGPTSILCDDPLPIESTGQVYLHINIVLYCLCFCYFHVMDGWTQIYRTWDNQQPGCRTQYNENPRQTVMTWELESSSTAATYRQHCTLGNNGQPTFSRVHCQTSLCELWVLQIYTWWDDAMLTTISVQDPVHGVILYTVPYSTWYSEKLLS